MYTVYHTVLLGMAVFGRFRTEELVLPLLRDPSADLGLSWRRACWAECVSLVTIKRRMCWCSSSSLSASLWMSHNLVLTKTVPPGFGTLISFVSSCKSEMHVTQNGHKWLFLIKHQIWRIYHLVQLFWPNLSWNRTITWSKTYVSVLANAESPERRYPWHCFPISLRFDRLTKVLDFVF